MYKGCLLIVVNSHTNSQCLAQLYRLAMARLYPSSKMCSDWGYIQPMNLSNRVFRSQGCGSVKCRDFNTWEGRVDRTQRLWTGRCRQPW